jgi:hypothetical protein
MSREVLGGEADDDLEADDGLGAIDDLDDLDDPTGPRLAGPTLLDRWAALLRRAPVAVATALALVTGALGWFGPDLVAATSPPPPLVVATVGSDVEIDSSTANTAVLTLPVTVANLGQTEVTVTGAGAEGRPVQLAPLAIARGGTGQARLRFTPSCSGPVDPMVPRLQLTDPTGAVVTVPVLGAAELVSLACGAVDQQAVAADGPQGPVTQVGATTRRGDQLVLRLQTTDGQPLLLTSADAGEVTLTVASGPMLLDGTPRDVVLQPPAQCPPTLVANGPQTVLALSLSTATGGVAPAGATAGSAPPTPVDGRALTAPQFERTYVAVLEDVPQVAAWLLHTVCSGNPA